jgi:hypothetical protein
MNERSSAHAVIPVTRAVHVGMPITGLAGTSTPTDSSPNPRSRSSRCHVLSQICRSGVQRLLQWMNHQQMIGSIPRHAESPITKTLFSPICTSPSHMCGSHTLASMGARWGFQSFIITQPSSASPLHSSAQSERERARCPRRPSSTKNTTSSSPAVRRPPTSSPVPLLCSDRVGHSVGGTAGCVVAGRLAAADPGLRILVLEAGPETHNNPAHTQPFRFPSHLAPGSRTTRVHTGRPSAALGGRSAAVPCGQCLGGGSSVNRASFPVHFGDTKSD